MASQGQDPISQSFGSWYHFSDTDGCPQGTGGAEGSGTNPVPSYQWLPVLWRARQDSRPRQSQQAEGSGRGVLKRLWVSRVKMGMFCPGTWRFSLKGDRIYEPGLCRLYRILYVCHAGTWADLASLARCQAHTNTHTQLHHVSSH